MADTRTQEELERLLRERQGIDNPDTAKDQLTAIEQQRPQYQKNEQTQAAYDRLEEYEKQRPQGYTPGQNVTQYQQQLMALQQQKPGEYASQYQSQIQDLINTINSRPGFNYNPGEDPAYKAYRDQYMRMGQRASEEAQAQAAALTGGYGNTYGASVGQQAYQGSMAELNSQIPALMQLAHQRYQSELSNDYNRLDALRSMDQYEYGKYRDQVGDYYTDLDYMTGRYDTEYNRDYGQYRDQVADYESQLDYLYQKYGDLNAENYDLYKTELELWLQNRDYYLDKYGYAMENAGSSSGSGGGGRSTQPVITPTLAGMSIAGQGAALDLATLAKQADLEKRLQERVDDMKIPDSLALRRLQMGDTQTPRAVPGLTDEDLYELTVERRKQYNKK